MRLSWLVLLLLMQSCAVPAQKAAAEKKPPTPKPSHQQTARKSPSPKLMRVPRWARVAPDVRFDPDSRLPLVVTHKKTHIEMALIPAGSFMRGLSKDDHDARSQRRGPYKTPIRSPFYLGRYEVTKREWRTRGMNKPDRPITNVAAWQVVAFLEYNGLWLPSRTQWEYACRGGVDGERYGPIDQVAWYAGNAKSAQDVGKKRPNAFGLYDMLGNVAEFVGLGYPESNPHRVRFGTGAGPREGDFVVGGSWKDPAKKCVGYGNIATFLRDGKRSEAVGFRVARWP